MSVMGLIIGEPIDWRGDRETGQAPAPNPRRRPHHSARSLAHPWVAAGLNSVAPSRTPAPEHGELLSYVFFAGEFAEELIALGRADAQRWLDEHPSDLWQLNPLPAWTPPPTATLAPLLPAASASPRARRRAGARHGCPR